LVEVKRKDKNHLKVCSGDLTARFNRAVFWCVHVESDFMSQPSQEIFCEKMQQTRRKSREARRVEEIGKTAQHVQHSDEDNAKC
jgi:hypothetical protein